MRNVPIGILFVGVDWPSLVTQLVRPFAISPKVLFAQVEEITVPVTTGLELTRTKTPLPLKANFVTYNEKAARSGFEEK